MDLEQEMRQVTGALEAAQIPYGLCGGMAMAVHGYPRATQDVDLVVLKEDRERILKVLEENGFTVPGGPVPFSGGDMFLERRTKFEKSSEEFLSMDLLFFSLEQFEQLNLEQVSWGDRIISVVGKSGLIALKKKRGSLQDLADIEKLSGEA